LGPEEHKALKMSALHRDYSDEHYGDLDLLPLLDPIFSQAPKEYIVIAYGGHVRHCYWPHAWRLVGPR
jgi:hypothetical protein